jgi:hypothetical protein
MGDGSLPMASGNDPSYSGYRIHKSISASSLSPQDFYYSSGAPPQVWVARA